MQKLWRKWLYLLQLHDTHLLATADQAVSLKFWIKIQDEKGSVNVKGAVATTSHSLKMNHPYKIGVKSEDSVGQLLAQVLPLSLTGLTVWSCCSWAWWNLKDFPSFWLWGAIKKQDVKLVDSAKCSLYILDWRHCDCWLFISCISSVAGFTPALYL